MSQYDYKPEYQRNLPHIQPPGAMLFVTFRLAGSIPVEVLRQLKADAAAREKQILQIEDPEEQAAQLYRERKRQFGRWDDVLDSGVYGPDWLRRPEIAAIVAEAMHHRDGKVYDLDSFCIMPTHGHTIFTPLVKDDGSYHALQTIMHSLKLRTALQSNPLLGREGPFWQHESYDHVVRDQRELERIRWYLLNNPVKAGLVETWEAWPWTYWKAHHASPKL